MSATTGRDLSKYHQPIGGSFSFPKTQEEWARLELSEEQVEFFHENGYLSGVRVLTDAQIDRLREELEGFFQPDHAGCELWYEYHANESSEPGSVLFHALGAWRLRPAFHDLLWNPAVTVPASQLLGGNVRFWHDQLFCKPARDGGVVAWHQDYSYWTRTAPMAHLTCWIGLDDSSMDNGCLHYISGSHRWDLLPMTELAGDMNGIRRVLSDEQWERFQKPVPIELEAGECSFHHPLTVHGSYANGTARPRRATVLNVVRDGVRTTSDQPLLAGTEALGVDQPLGGRFYPLLFDTEALPTGR